MSQRNQANRLLQASQGKRKRRVYGKVEASNKYKTILRIKILIRIIKTARRSHNLKQLKKRLFPNYLLKRKVKLKKVELKEEMKIGIRFKHKSMNQFSREHRNSIKIL